MKLTATTTSTSLYDLIKTADSTAMSKIESKRIQNELNWAYWVELLRDEDDIYIETILDTATTDSRPLNETAPIFAFNCSDLNNIKIIAESNSDFYCSIV